MEFLERFGFSSKLQIIGDVNQVLEGTVNSSNLRNFPLWQLRFALGSGTISHETAIGEAIVLNHFAYLSHINVESKLLTQRATGSISTPFLMGIKDTETPDAFVYLSPDEPISLEKLYERMLGEYPDGFVFLGHFRLKSLESVYLKKAPIYGEPINGEKAFEYWSELSIAPSEAFLFGTVLSNKGVEKFGSENAAKAFYHNPNERKAAPFLSHTHGAILSVAYESMFTRELNAFLANFSLLQVTGVRHVLTQSVIEEGSFCVFPLDGIEVS